MKDSNDEDAIQTLKVIAHAYLKPTSDELPAVSDLRAALAAAFEDLQQIQVTESELAQAALKLLAEDHGYAEKIKVLRRQPSVSKVDRSYFDASTIGLTAAVFLVLQTRLKFKINSDREWSVEIDKRSASDTLIKALVQRLLSFLDRFDRR
jgi:hypothetical protein